MGTAFEQLRDALADRYRVERELGSGGMATVYEATDLRHERSVAIKLLKPELAGLLGTERFLREITIAARLSHPHILPLHDSGETAGLLWYVMPLVRGESLRQRMEREGHFPVDDAVRIAAAVAAALDSAHRAGVVHRDIKPENILLQDGEPLVADFGIAYALSAVTPERLTATGMSLGTPHYMSPEQAGGESHIDGRSDIYSLGCVLYEMLTGRPPSEGSTVGQVLAARVLGRITPVRELRPDLPLPLQRALDKALAPAPGDRFATSGDFAAELSRLRLAAPRMRRPLSRPAIVGAIALMLAGGLALARSYAEGRRERWARTEGIAQFDRHARDDQRDAWYALGVRLQSIIPHDSAFVRPWLYSTLPVSVRTKPEGVRVYRRPYDDRDTTSVFLGTTPFDSVRVPYFASRLRLERPGYRTQDLVFNAFFGFDVGHSPLSETVFTLDSVGTVPDDMVRVTGYVLPREWLRLTDTLRLTDFWMDRYEVTNRQYREFVDSGGYTRREFWSEAMTRDGRVVPWEEAMRGFVDLTGQPGPATWQAGAYPEGQDNHPVAGVSWFEAAAYARFVKKQLPTYWHWRQGLRSSVLHLMMPQSNIARTGGPAAVGSFRGMSPFGTYDHAGNVREWVHNEYPGGRLILGGAWNDPEWVAGELIATSPWDRSPANGFRLARYAGDDAALAKAQEPVPATARRDYDKERPASPSELAIYQRAYAYDPLPLEARRERVDSARDWIREYVTFTAASGSRRMGAYVYLPRRARPPYQVVLLWPGSELLNLRRIEQKVETFHDFLPRSGRVAILPEYLGTFERLEELPRPLPPFSSTRWRDLAIEWVGDARRTLDYAFTRTDIDSTRVGFFGQSLGAWMSPLLLAHEPRVRAVVALSGGLWNARFQPESDPFNFLAEVRVPFLLMGHHWDPIFPMDASQRAMFDRLGTPAEHKKWYVHEEGAHYHMPVAVLAREALGWLDRYLGPVR